MVTTPLDVHGTDHSSFGTTNSGYKESTAFAQAFDVALPLPVGASIVQYSFRYYGAHPNTGNLSSKIVTIVDDVEIDSATSTIPPVLQSWQRWIRFGFPPVVVAEDVRYVLRFTAGGPAIRVSAPTVGWLPAP